MTLSVKSPNLVDQAKRSLLAEATIELSCLEISHLNSCLEGAWRGSMTTARVHALNARSVMIELLRTTREASELSGGPDGK